MTRIAILIAAPTRSFTVELERGRAVALGNGEGADVRVADPSVAEKHVVVIADERGAVVEGLAPATLNGVQVSGKAQARAGDELALGDTLIIFEQLSDAPAADPRSWPWDSFRWVVEEDLRRGVKGVLRLATEPFSLSEVEVERGGLSEVRRTSEGSLRFGHHADQLYGAFGSLAKKAAFAATDETSDAFDLFALALSRLLKLPRELDLDEQLTHDPVMLRLLTLAERFHDAKASVLIIGEQGAGKTAYARRIAPSAKPWAGESVAPAGALLIRHADALTDREQLSAALRAGRQVVATAAAPDDELKSLFAHAVSLPPLRDRRGDIEPLAEVFLTRARRAMGKRRPQLSVGVKAALSRAPFPRNVAELKSTMELAALVTTADEVLLDALPAALRGSAELATDNLRASLKNTEKEALLHALARTRWNVSAAARMLGLPRRTVVYRMSRLGLRRPARG